jgi:hypothetical protein
MADSMNVSWARRLSVAPAAAARTRAASVDNASGRQRLFEFISPASLFDRGDVTANFA